MWTSGAKSKVAESWLLASTDAGTAGDVVECEARVAKGRECAGARQPAGTRGRGARPETEETLLRDEGA
eukprot:14816447-Alexandrium_andersonii.AAC.1